MSWRICTIAAMCGTWFILRFPARGQPVPDLVAGGGVQRCGAGRRRAVVAVGEPGHVADVGQDAGGAGGADAEQVHPPWAPRR